jgi:hypothetical protein
MWVVKLYRKPDKPEFFVFVRRVGDSVLVNYPTHLPDNKRNARWFDLNEVHIDWIKEFV